MSRRSMWPCSTRCGTMRSACCASRTPARCSRSSATPARWIRYTIAVEGFPLGMFPAATYDEIVLPAEPGDMLVFFSDGVVDAQNPGGEMFGSERLVAALLANRSTARRRSRTRLQTLWPSSRKAASGLTMRPWWCCGCGSRRFMQRMPEFSCMQPERRSDAIPSNRAMSRRRGTCSWPLSGRLRERTAGPSLDTR